MMNWRPLFLFLLTAGIFAVPAQGQRTDQYQRSFGIGGVVRGNGIGGNLFYSWNNNTKLENQVMLDFVSHRHANEARIVNHKVSNKQPFVLGKLNHVGLSRLSYGKNVDLIGRGHHGRIAVAWQTNVGLTAAFLRPVYVRVDPREDLGNQAINIRYAPENIKDHDRIVGYSRNGSGWDEISMRPGVLFRSNISCTWSSYGQASKQLVAGVTLDYFPDGLPVMALYSNPNLYAGVFVGLNWMLNTQP